MGADSYYGHVAIVEGVNADGSIKISESNVKGLGVISIVRSLRRKLRS